MQRICRLPDSQPILHLGFKEPKWAASHVARQQPPSDCSRRFQAVGTRQLSSIIHSPPDRSKNTHHLHFSTTNPIQNCPKMYSIYIGEVRAITSWNDKFDRCRFWKHRIELNSKSTKSWKITWKSSCESPTFLKKKRNEHSRITTALLWFQKPHIYSLQLGPSLKNWDK